MAKIISLFNHKGGVSKTTTTFHLGWMFARLGKKVLIVDADPQCNLTGLSLGLKESDELFAFYDSKQNTDIFNSVAPVFEIDNTIPTFHSLRAMAKTKNPYLDVFAGNIRFSEIDVQLATAITSSETIPALRKFVGAINNILRKIAQENQYEIILVDMSPSVSATNSCILMSSDYFIVPTSPDFYCYQAIDSLSSLLPAWSKQLARFRDATSDYTLPKSSPKMLGFISQNYRVYTTTKSEDDQKRMASAYNEWLKKIKSLVKQKLVPELASHNMIIDENVFREHCDYDEPYHLAGIQNFNTLIPVSQKFNKPIFEIEQQDTGWTGGAWEKVERGKTFGAKANIEEAGKVYENFAISILKMMGEHYDEKNSESFS